MRQFLNIMRENALPAGDDWRATGIYQGGGSLYHGTSIYGLCFILKSDELYAGSDDGMPGVSLTTDFSTALSFSARADEVWGHEFEVPDSEVVIELDGNRLAQAMTCYEYTDMDFEEDEVRIPNNIKPLSGFIKRIHCDPSVIDGWIKAMPKKFRADFEWLKKKLA